MGRRFWIGMAVATIGAVFSPSFGGDTPAGCDRASRISVVDTPTANYFGQTVAADGTTVMVGSPGHNGSRGAVYVFEVKGSNWTFKQKLAPPSGPPPTLHFGASIAIDGTRAVIGATNGLQNPGAAYVFEFNGMEWQLQQRLSQPSQPNTNRFGYAVAIEGDTLTVCTWPAQFTPEPEAYLYRFDGGSWVQQQVLPGVTEGRAAMEGGQLFLVGSNTSDSILVYDFNGTQWSKAQSLFYPEAWGVRGESLDVRGDVLAVVYSELFPSERMVTVFRKVNGVWEPSDVLWESLFGPTTYSDPPILTIMPGRIVLNTGDIQQGLTVFEFDGAQWREERRITVPGVSDLGFALASTGDVLVATAPGDNGQCAGVPGCVAGSAWVFDVFADDCDNNLVADACDLADGSPDVNANSIVDDCECAPARKVVNASNLFSTTFFGWSVALDHATAAVGSTPDGEDQPDFVHVYGVVDGDWRHTQQISALDAQHHQRFGASLSIESGTMLVGASQDDNVNGTNAGAMYVFDFDGDSWRQSQKLLAWDGAAADFFSRSSQGLSGEYAAVGASRHDATGLDQGAVYIFRFDGTQWAPHQKLLIPEPQPAPYRWFGYDLCLKDDLLAVSSVMNAESSPPINAVYIYRRLGTIWEFEAKLNDPSPDVGPGFGTAVAIDGELVAVGATRGALDFPGPGSVYLFRRDAGTWSLQQHLQPTDSIDGNSFGAAIDIESGTMLVGSPNDHDIAPWSGAVYQCKNMAGVWTQTSKHKAADSASLEHFGNVVALSSDVALIGAYGDNNFHDESGAAYFIRGLAGDCNNNQSPDSCDISLGASLDANLNGIPDECEQIIGDTDGDLDVDVADLLAVMAAWGPCPSPPKPCPVDFDRNSIVSVEDLLILISHWMG